MVGIGESRIFVYIAGDRQTYRQTDRQTDSWKKKSIQTVLALDFGDFLLCLSVEEHICSRARECRRLDGDW